MSHIYDEHETIAALRRVVADKGPEHKYARRKEVGFVCLYWDRVAGCPDCIVGHVLAQFGFTDLPGFIEGKSLDGLVHGNHVDEQFARYFTEKFTMNALRLMAAAQGEQDQGTAWGGALHEAERVYARMTGRGE